MRKFSCVPSTFYAVQFWGQYFKKFYTSGKSYKLNFFRVIIATWPFFCYLHRQFTVLIILVHWTQLLEQKTHDTATVILTSDVTSNECIAGNK